MNIYIRFIDRVTNLFGLLAGILMITSVILVVLEIIFRTIFNSSIYISEEYSGYLLVAISLFSLAYTLKEKGHIRVDFLFSLFKKKKYQYIINVITYSLGFIVFSIITVITFKFFWDSLINGNQSLQISRTYLAIPQSAIPLGSLLISLQFISEILKYTISYRNEEKG